MTFGYIAHFNLVTWWQDEFSYAEREYIATRYQPLGLGDNALICGNIDYTSMNVVSLLSGLASYFVKDEDRHLAYRILRKAESMIDENTPALDIHFFYQAKIQVCYRDREKCDGLDETVRACKQQISVSSSAARAFKREFPGALPTHKGFEQLSIILEKQNLFDDAIAVCMEAKKQKWSGEWSERIVRCEKKKSKLMNK